MSTVRINDNIKNEITPILNDLGLSLSEAINIFLHQIKLNNGLPFAVKRRGINRYTYSGYGSYICENGHLHDYSKINFKKLEEEAKNNKVYNNIGELIQDIEKDE